MITKAIMLICVIIYVCINFIEKDSDKASLAIKYGALYPPRVEIKKEYWRLLTSNFVHVDILHIAMNLYGIYYLGTFFEMYLGTFPYIYLVLVSCLATTGLTYIMALKDYSLENKITLGASGIFYGYLGAMIALGVLLQGVYLDLLKDYMMVIVINIAFTFMNVRVSKTGHLGGLFGGFIAVAVLIWTGICVY
ncbi:MAG: rhomboid family intramembrane serine protease [Coprobacillaceae bacterium]